jgi:CubicO group peptidase (beta-lactamase class C family)
MIGQTMIAAGLSFPWPPIRTTNLSAMHPGVTNYLDDNLPEICSQWDLPGAIAGWFSIRPDGSTDQKLFQAGIRKAGDPSEMTSEDRCHLGSCTKAMTATLLAIFVDRGQFSWDSTLSSLIPDEPWLKDSPWGPVTIDQLISHRAGLPANTNWWRYQELAPPTRLPDSLLGSDRSDQLILVRRRAILRSLESIPRPDSPKFEYSNLGYCIAGHALESLTGRSWERLMQTEIFQPLGMTTAGFGAPSLADPNSPWGHHRPSDDSNLPWVAGETDNAAVLGPAGSVHASCTDWIRFLQLHLRSAMKAQAPEGHPERRLGLQEESLRHLHSDLSQSDYGGGWGLGGRTWAKGRILTHTGSNTTWTAMVFLAPRIGQGILAVTNAASPKAAEGCDQILQWILRNHMASRR